MSNSVLQVEYFRPSDAPKVVGVSRATIYRWKDQNHIKLYKQGSMTFVKLSEIKALIEDNS